MMAVVSHNPVSDKVVSHNAVSSSVVSSDPVSGDLVPGDTVPGDAVCDTPVSVNVTSDASGTSVLMHPDIPPGDVAPEGSAPFSGEENAPAGAGLPVDALSPVDAESLSALFNQLFAGGDDHDATVLVAGGAEPEYFPAGADSPARLVFRADYVSSALHEISHWCIAGRARRRLPDLGYWYAPDGRNAEQQREFEQVEVKPQALEWALSLAAGVRFHLSVDNLDGDAGASDGFRQAVFEQCQRYFREGLPPRAARLFAALAARFRPGSHIEPPTGPL